MFGKTTHAAVLCLATGLLTLPIAPTAQAGGFGLTVEVPTPQSDAAPLNDAVLVVHTVGCHGPGASVSAKAEGQVNGKRISIPIKLAHLGDGAYAVKRQWPTQGVWVLSLSAKSARYVGGPERRLRPTCNALVELGPDGNVKNVRSVTLSDGRTKQMVRVRYITGKDKVHEINTALRELATQSKQAGNLPGEAS